MEDLDRRAGRVGERGEAADEAGCGFVVGAAGDGDAGCLERGDDRVERGVVGDLPADGRHLDGVAGYELQPVGMVVPAVVAAGVVGAGGGHEPEHVGGEGLPRVEVRACAGAGSRGTGLDDGSLDLHASVSMCREVAFATLDVEPGRGRSAMPQSGMA